MAGSIANMKKLNNQKSFTYIPPTTPAELIDCSNFILDFTGRKFLNVRLDPSDEFNAIVQIITPSRYINMPADFLRRIFSLMGNILSFILELPHKYKRNLFLETDSISLSSMVYRGENVLVIESKKKEGCRVLLNRTDLMKLQYLEWSIFETIARKSTIIRPVVLKQFEIIGNYIDRKFTNVLSPPKTIEEMIIFIKNLWADQIIKNIDLNFVSQLKMFAAPKLAEQRLRWSREMSPELFVDPISPLSPPIIPKKYSPSQYNDDNDAQLPPTKSWDITPHLFSSCFFDGECSQINPTQATYCVQNRESNSKLFVDPISPLSPPSPPIIMAPKKNLSPSPQYTDDNDAQPPPRQLFSPSFFDDECSQINLTQATWVSVNQASNDEDDEPLHFNQRPKQKNKSSVKRKLFE